MDTPRTKNQTIDPPSIILAEDVEDVEIARVLRQAHRFARRRDDRGLDLGADQRTLPTRLRPVDCDWLNPAAQERVERPPSPFGPSGASSIAATTRERHPSRRPTGTSRGGGRFHVRMHRFHTRRATAMRRWRGCTTDALSEYLRGRYPTARPTDE